MTQDEWNQGIQNEAQTVQDEQWTAEALAHVRNQQRRRAVLHGVGAAMLGGLFGAGLGVMLSTQTVILERQAHPVDLNLFTFVRWDPQEHSPLVQTALTGYSPSLPILALIALIIGSATASRRGVPLWSMLLAAGMGLLTLPFTLLLIFPSFPGLPVFPLLVALGMVALGTTLVAHDRPSSPEVIA